DRWLGSNVSHRVRCANGHACTPRPIHVRQGGGVCRVCVGTDTQAAETAFRARLAELGAVLLESKWLGSNSLHRVQCARGHVCTPRPHDVQSGHGICRTCAGKAWDAFYVVRDGGADVVKFGITSGDSRPRLAHHARQGFTEVLRLRERIVDDGARELELAVLAALRDAGEAPVRGLEYFPGRALPLVLDLVDSHPAFTAA
ncbi:hypothetical protein, partial [Streptomyces arboris]|uniref:hypothetical protein n=1 Tax=Streptomyces arboris TaxID=2600619 RepID=UPI003BF511FF